MARSGYAVRFLHRDFLSDFGCLADHRFRKWLKSKYAGGAAEGDTADAIMVRKLLASPELQ